ncbi:hypothetical protein LINPERPRIM_LOCUS25715, partial [Linum perenne]
TCLHIINCFLVLLGKYYVVDSGFANAPGFLAPLYFEGILLIFRRLDTKVDPKVVKNSSTTSILVFAMSLNDVLVF